VDHLRPALGFYVGESQGKDAPVDYLLTPEVLGATAHSPHESTKPGVRKVYISNSASVERAPRRRQDGQREGGAVR